MADGRSRNGNKGHSTKAKSPNDKRLNPAKKLLETYLANNVTDAKIQKLLNKLYQDGLAGDTKAASLFLSYILGKPKETKDIKVELDKNFPEWLEE